MALTDPTADDIDRLAKQWLVANRIVREQMQGAGLDQSIDDLARLQQVLDANALSPTQRYELQCLGVALGRVLASNVEGLDWAISEDAHGRDPTIRYRQRSIQLNVLTMISKRVENAQPVDVVELYEQLRAELGRLVDRAD